MANEFNYVVRLAAQDILKQAQASASADAQKAVGEFFRVFSRAVYRDRHTRIKTLFSAAAADAAGSMVTAYKKRPNKTRSSMEMSPYRNDQRFSGGKLLTALSSSAMYKVTETGVQFINVPLLDQEAKQWRRLNFGAGARGHQTPPGRHYKMKIFGQVLPGDFGLFDIGPRPTFVVPPGFWSSSYPQVNGVKWNSARRGNDFFILGAPEGFGAQTQTKRQQRASKVFRDRPTVSLGIQGSRFLDVGVGRLVQTLPVALEKVISEWFKEAKSGTGPVFKNTLRPSKATVAETSRFIEQVLAERANNRTTGGFISRLP